MGLTQATKSIVVSHLPWAVPWLRRRHAECRRLKRALGRFWLRLRPGLEGGRRAALERYEIGEPAVRRRLERLIATDNERCPAGGGEARLTLVTHALSPGGAERQWCYLARELATRGLNVSLLVLGDLAGNNAHYLPLLGDAAVAVHSLPAMAFSQAEMDVRYMGLNVGEPVRSLAVALRRLGTTHLLCQLDSVNIHGAIAGLIPGNRVRRILLSFRNGNPTRFPAFYQPWMRDLYGALVGSGRVVLSGNSLAGNADYAEWLGVPAESIAHTPNAFVPPLSHGRGRRETRRELGIPDAAPLVVGVFRLAREKNPRLFVDVVAGLAARLPGLRALHCGEGHLAAMARRRAKALGLGGCLRFLGVRDDVHDLLHAADAMLLCSDHEGLPNVILEAGFAGTPVVATRAGGVPEAVRDGETGFLADIGDADGLIGRCLYVLGDRTRGQAMGRKGRKLVVSSFTASGMADAVLRALDTSLLRLP